MMESWNLYLADRPHRVPIKVEHLDHFQYVHASSEDSCWHITDEVDQWLHDNAKDCWLVWEEYRYMNNQDLYEDCSDIQDAHRHTKPFIAFRSAEDAILFKLTW